MVHVDETLCVGCGMCMSDCISSNIGIRERKAVIKKECFLCGHCVAVCPIGALSIPEYDMDDVEEFDEETFSLDPENVLHSIKFRRSIRNYRDEEVEQEVLEKLLQAGRYTATAKNNQDCTFVFVQKELDTLKEMVWNYIDNIKAPEGEKLSRDVLPYIAFNRRRKADASDDYLFRNAPVVLFITSDWPLDAGLAAQNIENMAVSLELGALYNGFLTRIADVNEDVKKWLGIEGKTIKATMLLGYPKTYYARTAPRKAANVIWK